MKSSAKKKAIHKGHQTMQIKPKVETYARIKVLGIGGSGTNAVHRMSELGIKGVEFVSINTDAQALHNSSADRKVHIGKNVTRGLGAGMNPDQGKAAAEESRDEIMDAISNADMVFITSGLGGGTGTGAAPVIAELAKNAGILTVAVVTKPFTFEGTKRKDIAEEGYANLKEKVDAIISIANDRILQIIDKKTSLIDAFKTVDEVLRHGIQGISDLITAHGVVNADFADVRTITEDAGTALMGIGIGTGENRAADAARNAINSPLLELAIDGAKGVLFNITGPRDLSMFEIDEAAKIITKSVDPEARIKFGTVIDDELEDAVKITVIATGFDEMQKKPTTIRSIEFEEPVAPAAFTPFSASGFSSKQSAPAEPFKRLDDIKRDEKKFDDDLLSRMASTSSEPKRQSALIERADLDEEKPEPKQASARKPLFGGSGSTAPSSSAAAADDSDGNDELDIPAFIRKKMK